MKARGMLLLCLLLFACEKVDLAVIENLNGNRIGILGHGGNGFPSVDTHLPPNSMASITKAVEGWNVEGIEVDIQMSKDSVIWLYHDPSLASLTNCQSCVYLRESKELEQCQYRKSNGFKGSTVYQMIQLKEVIERFAKRSVLPVLYLDVKNPIKCPLEEAATDYIERFARTLIGTIDRYNDIEKILIETSNIELIKALYRRRPGLKIIYPGRPDAKLLADLKDFGLYGLGFSNESTEKAEIAKWHATDLRIVLWNVRIRSAAVEAIQKSPDYIMTENISLVQQMLKK